MLEWMLKMADADRLSSVQPHRGVRRNFFSSEMPSWSFHQSRQRTRLTKVSNRLDDPLIWGVLPLVPYGSDPSNHRWGLGAHDICFKNQYARMTRHSDAFYSVS
jgi:hypothetical protein